MSDDASQQASLDEIVDEHTGESREAVDAGKIQEIDESPVEGWDLRRLGEVISLEYGENLTEDERDAGQYPVYGSNGQVGSHSEAYIDRPGIIVGRKGSIGEVEFSEVPFHPIDTTYYISQEETDENLRFVYYLLENVQLSRLNAASAVPGLNRNDAYGLKGLIPPIEEQRKIASVLYTVDQAIQKTEEIVDQIGLVQKGLTSDLFTTGPRDSETADHRLGPVATELPVHWETKTIGELYSDRQLGTDERGTSDGSTHVDLIKMGNLGFGTWDLSEVERIDRDPELMKDVGLEQGDLLFNTRNTPELVGKTAVWEFDREAIYDNNLLRLRFGDQISSGHYVNYYLSSKLGRRQLRSRVHGTTSVAAIYWSDLEQVTIPVPPKEEQSEIVDILRTYDNARRRSETYRGKLRDVKQGLMQDLLSGDIRTVDKDIAVPPEVEKHG